MSDSAQLIAEIITRFEEDKIPKINAILGSGGEAISLLLEEGTEQRVGRVIEVSMRDSLSDQRKDLERESQLLQQLDHQGIPKFYKIVEGENCLMQVRDYIPGKTLEELISAHRTLPEKVVVPILDSVLEILQYLHDPAQHRHIENPIIHRDIKPSNILIGDDGKIYLIDFSIAHTKNGRSTTMAPKGTFGYMPKEQYGGLASPSSDLYALGVSTIHALLGKVPDELVYSNKSYNIPRKMRVDRHLNKILRKMTEPERQDRYQSALEIRESLRKYRSLRGYLSNDKSLDEKLVQTPQKEKSKFWLLTKELLKSPFRGALPYEVQERRLKKRLEEGVIYYHKKPISVDIASNTIVEFLSVPLLAGYATQSYTGGIIGLVGMAVISFFRAASDESCGSPFIGAPYHIIKSIKEFFNEYYGKKK